MSGRGRVRGRRTVGRIILSVVFVALGLGALLYGWHLAAGVNELSLNDSNYWAAVAVNVGTTLLLAIALVLFEQRLVAKVDEKADQTRQEVDRQTRAQVGEVRNELAALSDRATTIEQHLGAINEDFAKAKSAAESGQASILEDVVVSADREAVKNALVLALGAGAIGDFSRSGGGIVIPAGAGVTAPRIRASFYPERHTEDGHSAEEVRLQYETGADSGNPYILWPSQTAVGAALALLVGEMQGSGHGQRAESIDAAIFVLNLQTAISEAMEAAKGRVAWRLPSPVREYIADGWVITGNGIETRDHGLLIDASDYPHIDDEGHLTSPVRRQTPGGVDGSTLELAKERGSVHFEDRQPW